jgi:hypothetical protein
MAGGGSTIVDSLDSFMNQVTDKKFVDDARDFMKGGSLNKHQDKQ